MQSRNGMVLRVNKQYLGDTFTYKVFIFPSTYKCTIRQVCTDNIIQGQISSDFKKVLLSTPLLVQGINGEKPKHICKLTIPKIYSNNAREYILGV